MLIDNKIDRYPEDGLGIKSVWDFIRYYTSPDKGREGALDIVTGFFSVAGLSALQNELSTNNAYRLILAEMVSGDDFKSKVIDLLQGDSSIENALRLSEYSQNALAFLKHNTVQVKAITNAFCHAKTYIFKDYSDPAHHYYLTGSSNLTDAGLGRKPSSNAELNLAETGNGDTYKKHKDWFADQWENVAQQKILSDPTNPKSEKIDVKQYFIDMISQAFKVHTPEEIYYKILFELFQTEIDFDTSLEHEREMTLLQDSEIYRTLFNYQKSGVVSLIKMLRKWNGAILADAVGLGKTFSALAVMKYYQNNGYTVLLLCPKKLEYNWKQYLKRSESRFERDAFDYIVRFHTDLQDDRLENAYTDAKLSYLCRQQKLLVVIDESHNLRNADSERYKTLMNKLLADNGTERDVKVLLLSATPINNGLTDIRNQFNIIAKGDDGYFNNDDFEVKSLMELFREAQRKYNEWSEDESRKLSDFVGMLPQHFFGLTDRLIVARTRNLIERTLGEDLQFPRKRKPQNIYKGVSAIGKYKNARALYDALTDLKLTAYQPTKYINGEETAKDWQDDRFREKYLVKMMTILFMKRLESSWYSCKLTIEKVLEVHKRTLNMVKRYLETKDETSINFEIDDMDELDDEYSLRGNAIRLSDMKLIDRFESDLEYDVKSLQAIADCFSDFAKKLESGKVTDQKMDTLAELVKGKSAERNPKVVIFTTFTDTAQYIYDKLQERGIERIACVTGEISTYPDGKQTQNFTDILQRFAPYSKLYKEKDWSTLYEAHLTREKYNEQTRQWDVDYAEWQQLINSDRRYAKTAEILKEQIDVLVATDCLSEGQNLQDADMVVNFDIHWNPVRLIQRFGRIDRIGSPNEEVQSVNFWPTENLDAFIDLTNRINNRMATMLTAGTETIETTEKYSKIVEENPLFEKNAQKLLRQLAEDSISDIESTDSDGQNLGMQNLSLEMFRQDLIDYFDRHKDMFRSMPCGVFSGFKNAAKQFASVPESLVAVLGYPHREHKKENYKQFYLMCQPANGEPADWHEMNRAEILNMLRVNKNEPTFLPEWIERPDTQKVQRLSGILKEWLRVQMPQETKTLAHNILRGNKNATDNNGQTIEQKFNLENFDLIAWEYISTKKD
ncbi:MAG: DEAD/DEAH box helicase family protein [Bacteroidales bacterium]|nr:DEAD/DEAH box helicase family protein [Bacteroidales bacterium]